MIGIAKQNGSTVEVYDTNGRYLWSKLGILQGYTSTTVSIQNGSTVTVYGERGEYKFSR